MLVWGGAGCLAFAATFLRAGMLGLPLGAGLSLGLLLRSLTALLLGRLTRLPVIAAAAVALGVLELGVDWNQNSRSEEHTSELQSLMRISYAVFCLQKKTLTNISLHTMIRQY